MTSMVGVRLQRINTLKYIILSINPSQVAPRYVLNVLVVQTTVRYTWQYKIPTYKRHWKGTRNLGTSYLEGAPGKWLYLPGVIQVAMTITISGRRRPTVSMLWQTLHAEFSYI